MSPGQPTANPPDFQAEAAQAVQGWGPHIDSLDPQHNMPDDVRSIMAERYFDSNIKPVYLKHGENSGLVYNEFMKYAGRPDKSAHPILHTAGAAVANAIMQPVLGATSALTGGMLKPWQEALEKNVADAASDATKQGAGPMMVGAAKFIGDAIGQAPYYAPFGGLSRAAQALGAPKILGNALAGGAINGVYQGLKSQNFVEGMKGAAEGAAFVGGIEGAGKLAGFLMGKGVPEASAKAIEAAAKGIATPAETDLAAQQMQKAPQVLEQIHEWGAGQIKGTHSSGVPGEANVGRGDVKATVLGADGKSYSGIQDAKPESKAMQNLGAHLDTDGQIISLEGQEDNQKAFLQHVEQAQAAKGHFDLDAQRDPDSEPETIRNEDARGDWIRHWKSILKPTDIDTIPEVKAERIGPEDVPELDKSEPPEAEPTFEGIPRVRGANPTLQLNQAGHLEAEETANGMARRIAGRSSVTTMSGNGGMRAQQTLDYYAKAMPDATRLPDDPRMRSLEYGIFTGDTPEAAEAWKKAMWSGPDRFKNINIPMPGADPSTGNPGDSLGSFFQRVTAAAQDMMRNFWKDPDAIHVQGTHSSDISLLKGVIKGNGMLDPEDMLNPEMETGQPFTFRPKATAPEGSLAFGDWEIRKINPQADRKLEGGIILQRHGQTDWNSPTEVPGSLEELGHSQTAQSSLSPRTGTSFADTINRGEGEPGDIRYHSLEADPDEQAKFGMSTGRIFHENFHALNGSLGLHDYIADHWNGEFVDQIFDKVFDPDIRQAYLDRGSAHKAEEIAAYLGEYVRSGNEAKLKLFADADTDEAHVLQWTRDKYTDIMQQAANKGDTVWSRGMVRRAKAVVNMATNQLEDIKENMSQAGLDIKFLDGLYNVEDTKGVRHFFGSRKEMQAFFDEYHQEPLNAPQLVPDDLLPEGFPRPTGAVPNTQVAPSGSDPVHPELSMGEKPVGGVNVLGSFVQPFPYWLARIAEKIKNQNLYDRYAAVRDAFVPMANEMRGYYNMLKEGIASKTKGIVGKYIYDAKRQTDFTHYLMADNDADRGAAIKEFNLDEHVPMLRDFEDKMKDTGFLEFLRGPYKQMYGGMNLKTALQTQPLETFERKLLSRGRIDPSKDSNLTSLASHYLEGQLWDKHIKKPLEDAEDLVKDLTKRGDPEKGENDGPLYPLRKIFQRQNEYYRGIPDYTQEVVRTAVGQVVSRINQLVDKANTVLPEGGRLGRIEAPPEDVLRDWILFSYAGSMGLKPALLVRAAMGLFTTGLPILDSGYLRRGMSKAMSSMREDGKDAFQLAQDNGWLMSREGLKEVSGIASTQTDNLAPEAESRMEKVKETAEAVSNKAMSFVSHAHNASRLATGWGFKYKIEDALKAFAEDGNKEKLLTESGFAFLPRAMQENLAREASKVVGYPESMEQYALRNAKHMVDATQWPLTKGDQPMLYKYKIGQLLGQFGTWPMNYIDYARRLALNGPVSFRAKNLARLAIAHKAILETGALMGIDLHSWVFTQPMAYSGGPILSAVQAVPPAVGDWKGARGSEARKELFRQFVPGMLPGGDEAHDVWETIVNADKGQWSKILGFNPLEHRSTLDR